MKYACAVCVVPGCGGSKADIVFLVDESSSIGANNFIKMKDFIFRVATYFPVIGPQATQVGLPRKSIDLFTAYGSGVLESTQFDRTGWERVKNNMLVK